MMLFKIVKGKKEFHPKILEYIKSDDDKLIPLLQCTGIKDAVDSTGTTLLHLAARHGNARLTLHLKRSACEIDAPDHSGTTPLMTAVHHQQLEQVQLLLLAKASIGRKDKSGDSVLKIALKYDTIRTGYLIMSLVLKTLKYMKDRNEIIQILKDAGCPLYRAIYADDPQLMAMYIDSGMPIDMQNPGNRNTALHMAAMLNDSPMVEMLLEKGADAKIKNVDGYTAFMISLHYTASMKIEDVVSLCNNVKSWTDRDSDGKLMLHPIFAKSATRTLKLFLKTYAITDINARDSQGSTLLHYVAENKDIKAIEVVEDFGLEVNAQDEKGRTALHLAVLRAVPSIVEFLLKKGADTNVKDNEGRTPLFYAFLDISKKVEMVDGWILICLLLQHGADPEIVSTDNKTVIDLGFNDEEYNPSFEPIIAHLTMSAMLGKPISNLIRKQINAVVVLKKHYRNCRVELQTMKEHVIFDSITLFNILTDDDARLAEYAEQPTNAYKIMETTYEKVTDWYYRFALKNNLQKVAEFSGMKDLYEERQKLVIDRLARKFIKSLNI